MYRFLIGVRYFAQPGTGTEKKELVQCQFALKNISLRETEFLLEIPRGDDLAVEDDVFQIRRVFAQRIDYRVAERFAFLRPRAIF